MGTTLDNGIYLPDEGERNCYEGLAGNWVALDNHLGSTNIHVTINDKQAWNGHVADTTIHVTSADKQAWDGHVADSVKHVTAEDKQAWNGKADASALTAHTGNTTIHVTAADKAKWDAVTSKANDSDVVHKSGDETVGGVKTFDSNTFIYNSDNTATTPTLYLKSSKIEISSQGNTSGDQNLTYLDKNNTSYAYVKGAIQSNGSAVKIRAIAKDSSNNLVINELQMLAYTNGNKVIFPAYSNEIDLGVSNYKWKSFNGINPGALGLPNYALRTDISGYILDVAGGNNTYTPPADGFVFVRSDNATYLSIMDIPSGVCQVSKAGTADTMGLYFPVLKGRGVYIKIVCTSLNIAYFIPSQGNA